MPLENDPELQQNAATIQTLKNQSPNNQSPNNQSPNNQSLSAYDQSATSNNIFDTQSLFASNAKQIGRTENSNGQVSPEERRRACEELKPNGCGAKGDWKSRAVPNVPNGFDFTKACNNHDIKFGTLGYDFERANNEFYRELMAVPPITKYVMSATGKSVREEKVSPAAWARLYYNAVSSYLGRDAYNKVQKNAYICKYGRRPK